MDCARALVALGAAFDLVLSPTAEQTLAQEVGPDARDALAALAAQVHPVGALGARIASGSYPVAGMIVAPCSMRSLAAIAHGLDDNLLTRAAGVQLKERRPLILLAREAPLTLAHLRNMTAVTEMGAVVLPPVPAFYLRPQTTAEITAQIAARAVDLLHLAPPVARAWTPEMKGNAP
jgi:4-hydroxy-3-polyprenylbenzoate decarboxylase